MQPTIRIGGVAGTGAAINVELGWVPDFVLIANWEDADMIHIGFPNIMAAGTALAISTAVATLGSNGISAYDGSDSATKGFTIGSTISENGKDLAWIAFRNAEGVT